MALKRKLTQEEYDKLPKDLQGEYVEKDGEFFLSVEGEDDPDALRRARDREKEDAKKLRKDLKQAQDRLAELEGDDSRKKGDIDKIDAAWKAKLDKIEADRKADREKYEKRVSADMIKTSAAKLAAEISTSPDVISLHIEQRLRVEFDDDGEPSLVVLDKDGKGGNTLDGLKKEFLANKSFASILTASKGSGGGANKAPTSPSGGAGGQATHTDVDLSRPANLDALRERVNAARQKAS